MLNYSKNTPDLDLSVLARLPYRGIQKQIAAELGVTSGAVNRRLKARDIGVMRLVVKKMLKINEKVAKVEVLDRKLSEEFIQAAQGSNVETTDVLSVSPPEEESTEPSGV